MKRSFSFVCDTTVVLRSVQLLMKEGVYEKPYGSCLPDYSGGGPGLAAVPAAPPFDTHPVSHLGGVSMAGRILSGDAYERYVELSHEYDVFSWSPALNQTVAAFNGETVVLHKLSKKSCSARVSDPSSRAVESRSTFLSVTSPAHCGMGALRCQARKEVDE